MWFIAASRKRERESEWESNKTWIDCAVYAREWRRLLDCVCQKSTTNFSFVDTIHSVMHGIHSYIFDTKMPQRESYMSCFFLFLSLVNWRCEFNKTQHVHLNTQLLQIWFEFGWTVFHLSTKTFRPSSIKCAKNKIVLHHIATKITYIRIWRSIWLKGSFIHNGIERKFPFYFRWMAFFGEEHKAN